LGVFSQFLETRVVAELPRANERIAAAARVGK
jgi:hypothetical protein